jgi:hypothetical protein
MLVGVAALARRAVALVVTPGGILGRDSIHFVFIFFSNTNIRLYKLRR